jgi:hypothetical protein
MSITITNCTECTAHKIKSDPDPSDLFNDDDVKVVCSIAKKNITTACRPYNIKKECEIPSWCPKNKRLI